MKLQQSLPVDYATLECQLLARLLLEIDPTVEIISIHHDQLLIVCAVEHREKIEAVLRQCGMSP